MINSSFQYNFSEIQMGSAPTRQKSEIIQNMLERSLSGFLGARAPLDLLNVKVKVKVMTAKKFRYSRSLPYLSEVLKNV